MLTILLTRTVLPTLLAGSLRLTVYQKELQEEGIDILGKDGFGKIKNIYVFFST